MDYKPDNANRGDIFYIQNNGTTILARVYTKERIKEENLDAFLVARGYMRQKGEIKPLEPGTLIQVPLEISDNKEKCSNKKEFVEKGLVELGVTIDDLVKPVDA